MKTFGRSFWILALVLVVASAVQAQRPERGSRGRGMSRPRPGMASLLTQKSVQEELKLTEGQLASLKHAADKQREGFRGSEDQTPEERRKQWQERAKASEASVSQILQPEQVKRLKQISLQVGGPMAFASPAVADSLQLTDDQKDKMKTVHEEAMKAMRALYQDGNREEARPKMEAARKAAMAKLLGILTPEQTTKWKEMTGEPFTGEIQRREFPGGRRPRGDAAPKNEKKEA